MSRLNVFADEPWDMTAEKSVVTRNPFEKVPEGGDKGHRCDARHSAE